MRPGSNELEVEGLAAGGRGVARIDGRVWFIRDAIPGDRVIAHPERERARFVEAVVERYVTRSELRREPACPLQASCPGCPWMVLEESAQLAWKRTLIVDALERIGGLGRIEPSEMIASPAVVGYRGRIELGLGRDADGNPALGYRGESGALIDIPACAVQHPTADAVLTAVRELLLVADDPKARARLDARPPFRILLRHSRVTGSVLVAVREAGLRFTGAHGFARALRRRCSEVSGVVRIVGRPSGRGGARVEPLDGDPFVEERQGDLALRLPATTFSQVNPAAAELLLTEVIRSAGHLAEEARLRMEGTVVWDLYGGVGLYGHALARAGASVTVCDADGDAVRAGRRAAVRDSSIEFVHSKAERFLSDRADSGSAADLIVVNPPRAGLGRGVGRLIRQAKPAGVVMISCDPATLARDLREMANADFKVVRLVGLDLFPQTAHVEVVAALRSIGDRGEPAAC